MNGAISRHDAAVSGMFTRIARFYDILNHVLSLGIDRSWRKELARAAVLGEKHRFLDLAAGTLDVSIDLLRNHPTSTVLAMDFCLPMLVQGSKKLLRNPGKKIFSIAADGKKLPLPDCSVDSVTIAFGIRNIQPRQEALREMHRVLVPGGRACILEFGSGREKIFWGVYNAYLTSLLPRIGRIVSKDRSAYMYLARTICEFPSARQLATEMYCAGFQRVWFRKLTSGIVCLHVGEKSSVGNGSKN